MNAAGESRRDGLHKKQTASDTLTRRISPASPGGSVLQAQLATPDWQAAEAAIMAELERQVRL